jgi:hypothetical protein
MEQELSQGVSAIKNLTAAVFESGGSFQSLVSNISAVGFAAKLHILGTVMQAIGGLANMFKGLFEGMTNTENQLIRLSTSLRGMGRDADKSTDLFQQAIAKAAETPYDLNEVLRTVTQLGGYGVAALDEVKNKAGQVITDIRGKAVTLVDVLGNVAGATGMGLERTMEAYADAIMGEWERMKEFGIKKEMIPGLAQLQAGSPQYKAVLNEWLATTQRFAGGMLKQAQSISGMLSNFGDVFTRFGIEVGGTANKALKNNVDAFAAQGAADVMKDVKSGKVSRQEVLTTFKVDKSVFNGLIEGSTEYNRRLELAIKTSEAMLEQTDKIGKAGTLYDAIRISIRQMYNAFGAASNGISQLGTAAGQWLKQIWITFIYPIFDALAGAIRWVGKMGDQLIMSFIPAAKVAGDTTDEIGRRQRTMVERIGFLWGIFLAFWWNPLINAIKAVIGFIGRAFSAFEEGFTKNSGKASIFAKIWEDILTVGKEIYDFFKVIIDIVADLFSTLEGTGVFKEFFALLGRIVSLIWDRFIGGIRVAIAFLQGFASAFWDAVKPAVEAVGKAFAGLFKAVSEVLDDLFGGDGASKFFEVIKSIASFIGSVLGFVIGTLFKAIGFILAKLIEGVTFLIKGIGMVIRGLIDAGKAVYDGLGKALAWLYEKWINWIVNPIKALAGWFEAVFETILAGVRRAVNAIREYTPGLDTRGASAGKTLKDTIDRGDIGAADKLKIASTEFKSFTGGGANKLSQALAATAGRGEAASTKDITEIQRASNELAGGAKEVNLTVNVDGKPTKFKINGASGSIEVMG